MELQRWHAAHGDQNLQSLSAGNEGGGQKDNHRLVKEMMDTLFKDEEALRGQGQPHYFKLTGYVQRIMYDEQRSSYFIGCPECKKKLAVEREGLFRCETCNKSIPEHDARVTYTLTAKFADSTDGLFVSLIGEQADTIVGVKGSDFRNMREVQMASSDQLRELMNQANFSYHSIVVRAKVDDY